MDNVSVLWERQAGETAAAFEAFAHYRDSGSTRSLRDTRRALDRPWTTISDWSKKYRWVIRVAAFDAEQDRANRIKRQEDAEDARERAVKGAQLVQRIALKGLMQIDGRMGNAEENPPGSLLRYWKEAVEMEFVALGLPISVVKQQVEEPPSVADLQLREREEMYRRAGETLTSRR